MKAIMKYFIAILLFLLSSFAYSQNSNSKYDNEVNQLANKMYVSTKYVGICQGRYFYSKNSPTWGEIFAEITKPEFRLEYLPVQEHDRLNGVEFRVNVYFDYKSERRYDQKTNSWGDWGPFSGEVRTTGFEKKKGIATPMSGMPVVTPEIIGRGGRRVVCSEIPK